MISIAVWLVLGAVVGWLVNVIQRTNRQLGALINVALGVSGAVAGGFASRVLGLTGGDSAAGLSVHGVILPVVGALVAIGVIQLAWRRRSAKG